MAKKTPRPTATTGQLEPLLKAYALRRLQGEPVAQKTSSRAAKPQPKKRKKA